MRRILMIGLLAALALAACGDSGDTADENGDSAAGATIEIEGFAFSEGNTAEVGGEVTVVNRDDVAHTWTSVDDVFDSGAISPDGEFTFTFEEAGEYDFFCSIHPTMEGSVTVSG